MASVIADLQACQGYANCIVGASDYFDIDDEGLVVLLKTDVPDSEHKRVLEAVRSCPVSALAVVNES